MVKSEQGFKLRPLPLLIAGALAGMVPVAQAADGAALEEVIVTAQKVSENVQNIPISINTLNASMLEKSGVSTLTDIGALVPTLNLAPYPGSSGTLYPSIRGITPNQAIMTAGTPIVVQVNGVPTFDLTGLNMAGADLERIEILSGPQGVLAGKNATGGTLNIYTVKPDMEETWFKQQLTFAQRGQYLSKTVLNVPLSKEFAAKVAYVNSGRDNAGVTNSAPGGYEFGKNRDETLRIDLRWKPSNQFTIDYGYDSAKSKSYPTPWQCTHVIPGEAPFMPAGSCSASFQSTLYAGYALPQSIDKVDNHNLNIEWNVSQNLTVKSITGYRKLDAADSIIYGGFPVPSQVYSGTVPVNIVGASTPFNGNITQNKNNHSGWSEELQFLGKFSDRLKYTAGLFFSEDKGSQNAGPYVSYVLPGVLSFPPPYGFGIPGASLLSTWNFGLTDVKNTSKALYGQLTWTPDILDSKLDIVPGVRLSRDTRRATASNFTGVAYGILPTANPLTFNYLAQLPGGINAPLMTGDASFSNTSPAISFNYHLTRDVMGYFKYSTAYTPGGFDPDAYSQANFAKGFAPEKAKSMEIGMKGEFLDHRLRANLAVFQTKFSDEQKTVPVFSQQANTTVWMMQNAGGSEYNGLDLSLAAAITDRFHVTFDAQTLTHKYTSYVVDGVDQTNNSYMLVPKLTYSLAADYRFPDFGLPGRLDGSLSVSHKDSWTTPYSMALATASYTAAFTPDWMTTPAYTVWNGRLALSHVKMGPSNKGDLTAALWVKNLTNKHYMLFNSTLPNGFGSNFSEPRTVGMDLIYRFN